MALYGTLLQSLRLSSVSTKEASSRFAVTVRKRVSSPPVVGYYVQYGCGWSARPFWLNFDNIPTHRFDAKSMINELARHRFREM